MRRLRRKFPFDLVHAHYAVPVGDAVRRAGGSAPLVVSVHGHDVQGSGSGGPAVAATLQHARLVLANSAGTGRRCTALGARDARVVHLGADVPEHVASPSEHPTLVTVGHHGSAELDERQRAKQPDWSYDDVDSGKWPADRFDREAPVTVD